MVEFSKLFYWMKILSRKLSFPDILWRIFQNTVVRRERHWYFKGLHWKTDYLGECYPSFCCIYLLHQTHPTSLHPSRTPNFLFPFPLPFIEMLYKCWIYRSFVSNLKSEQSFPVGVLCIGNTVQRMLGSWY